jgi:hypothetical protein
LFAVEQRDALLIAGLEDLPADSEQERAAHDALNTFSTDGIGYFSEQTTLPLTIGYALLIHPSGWRPGCSTTTSSARQPRARSSASTPHSTQRTAAP